MMALVAGGAWAWPRVRYWRESQFAEQLARYAETAPDGAAVQAVREMRECGLAGVDSLVRLAGSPRPALALAAQSAVLNQLAAWETGFRVYRDERLLGRRLVVLATAVDKWSGRLEPAAQAWADWLILEIIDEATGAAPESAVELLAVCDRVLERSPLRRAPMRLPELPAEIAAEGASAAVVVEQDAPAPAIEPLEMPLDERFSEAAPVTEDGSASGLAIVDEGRAARLASVPGAANRLPPMSNAKPQAVDVAPVEQPAPEMKPRPLPAPPASAEVVDVPSPQQMRVKLRAWRQASDADLSARLRAASPYDALAIATVLRERGAESGALARWQRKLPRGEAGGPFNGLSQLAPAQARARLRQLISHADPEVRLQALAMLATSGDPQLDEIVRRRAVEDADPRVAELATRILRGEMR